MAEEKTPKGVALPQAQTIAGTMDDLAKKYKAAVDIGLKPVTPEAVASELAAVAARVRAGGLPEIAAVAGTLDDLAKKYKGASEINFDVPIVDTVAGTLDDLAKKYTASDVTRKK